jgi:AICAR transformylase/IMP cyclohydrolase PurH
MALRAILAPYDKTGLVELARGLEALGVEMFATGNTFRILRESDGRHPSATSPASGISMAA